MSSISATSGFSPVAYPRSLAATAPAEGSYEANLRRFGPVTASAIGAAEATGAAASTVVHLSSEALQALGDAIGSGYDALKSGVGSVASGVAALAGDGVDAVESVYAGVVDGVGDAVDAVTDTVGSAVGTVGQYATLGLVAGRQLLDEVA